MINKLVENHQIVQALWSAVNTSSGSLENVAPLVKKLLKTGAWKRREIPQLGRIVEFESFGKFITTKPLEGCGWPIEKVEALIRDDDEAVLLWRRAMTAPARRPLTNDNVITSEKPVQGNSKAYTLDRLDRERPDLLAKVGKGELSANAAAIEAGFRKPPTCRCPKCGYNGPATEFKPTKK